MGRLGEEAPRGLGLRSVVEEVAGGQHEPLVVHIEPTDLHEREASCGRVYAKWVMFAEILGTNPPILLYFCRGVAL